MNHSDTNDITATTMALDSVDGDGNTRIAGSDDGTSSVRCKHETTTSIASAPPVIDSTHPNTFPNTAQLHPPSGVTPQGAKVETHDMDTASITADTLTTITSTSTTIISPSSSTTFTTTTTTMATAVESSTSPISVSVVDAPSSTVSSLSADSEISSHSQTSSEGVTAESQVVTDHDPSQVQEAQGSVPDPIKPSQLDLQDDHQSSAHSTTVPLATLPQEYGHDDDDHIHPHEDKAPSFPSGRLPSLNVQTKAKPDNYERPTSSISASSTSTSSSTSSLSDYLIIGQEPVERDDSEYDDDRGSERSMPTSRRSSSRDSSTSSSSERRRDHAQEHEDYEAFGNEEGVYDRPADEPFQFNHTRPHRSQRRITETPAYPTEETEPQSFRRSSTPQNDRFRRRRSTRVESEGSQDNSTAQPAAAAGGGILPALPALKVPSVRGIVRSLAELVIASVICVTLVSCMFAFSYVSSGANHMLEWYADQRIGQRIRETIKEREHYVQEALEKMAGEEFTAAPTRAPRR
ncbi:MAG: hypothetical protein J3Q66DRAFT_366654 [Benniella sp.]|nr:MAG: hypothetical protein J3Q66DRAFT_366654 [Benniella sp.]